MNSLPTVLICSLPLLLLHQAGSSVPADNANREPFGVVTFDGESVRDWTNCLNNTIRGRLVALHGATIFMTVEGQEDTTVPLAFFCIKDREYVQSRLQATKKEYLFPGTADPKNEAATLRLSEAQWQKQLTKWARTMEVEKPSELAQAESAWNRLRNITDSNAVEPLTAVASRGTNIPLRSACIESLGHVGDDKAKHALVKLANSDRSGPVRAAATWALCCLKDPTGVLADYATYLRSEQFREPALLSLQATGLVRPLQSNDAIERELTEALIGMLVVKQRQYVPYYFWSGYDTGWVPNMTGTGGSRKAAVTFGRRWVKFDVPVPCELARSMLVRYSSQDFGYDRQSWRNWQTTYPVTARSSAPQVNH